MKEIFLNALSQQSGVLIFLVIFIVFVLIMKTNTFKGLFGEFIVNFVINRMLNKHKYKLLKNVTLTTEDGTTQIDHIIVSRYGIFVLETKNMKGWIFGKERDKLWTQQLFKKKFKFQNPLLQNYKHTKTISDKFNIPHDNIKSIVLFVGNSTLKNKKIKNVFNSVFQSIKYIKKNEKIIYSNVETFEIYKAIRNDKLPNTIKTHINHVNHLKNKFKSK